MISHRLYEASVPYAFFRLPCRRQTKCRKFRYRLFAGVKATTTPSNPPGNKIGDKQWIRDTTTIKGFMRTFEKYGRRGRRLHGHDHGQEEDTIANDNDS